LPLCAHARCPDPCPVDPRRLRTPPVGRRGRVRPREHQTQPDPYLFELGAAPDYLGFGYEQQGAIVEEYICCAALAPHAPRTARLENMLTPYFRLENMTAKLDRAKMVLPWDEVELAGICD